MGLPDGLKLFADDREISDDFPAIEFGRLTSRKREITGESALKGIEKSGITQSNKQEVLKHKATSFHDFSLKQTSSLMVAGIDLTNVCYITEFTLTRITRLETWNMSFTAEINRTQLAQNFEEMFVALTLLSCPLL